MLARQKIVSILFALLLLLSPIIGSSQTSSNENLVKHGKILDGKRSDIAVFREVNSDWKIIRTMKSRLKYQLDLNLNYNHYVIFHRKDGLTKSLHVKSSSSGSFIMKYDVVFSDFSTKYILVYKKQNSASYNYVAIKKNLQNIKIIDKEENNSNKVLTKID